MDQGISVGTIGGRVRELRREMKLTQEQLAEKAGLSVSAIRKLEQGIRSGARLDTLGQLAAVLGVSPAELLGPGPDPQASAVLRSPLAERDRELGARVRELLDRHRMSVAELEALVSTVAAITRAVASRDESR